MADRLPFGVGKVDWSERAYPVSWLHEDVWEILRQAQDDNREARPRSCVSPEIAPGAHIRRVSSDSACGRYRGRGREKVFLRNEPNFKQAGVEKLGKRSQKRTHLPHTTAASRRIRLWGGGRGIWGRFWGKKRV